MVGSSQSWRLKLLISLKEDEKLRTHWVIRPVQDPDAGFLCQGSGTMTAAADTHCLCPLVREAFSRKTGSHPEARFPGHLTPVGLKCLLCGAHRVHRILCVITFGQGRVTPLWASDMCGEGLWAFWKVLSSLLNWECLSDKLEVESLYIYSLLKKTILRKIFKFKKFIWEWSQAASAGKWGMTGGGRRSACYALMSRLHSWSLSLSPAGTLGMKCRPYLRVVPPWRWVSPNSVHQPLEALWSTVPGCHLPPHGRRQPQGQREAAARGPLRSGDAEGQALRDVMGTGISTSDTINQLWKHHPFTWVHSTFRGGLSHSGVGLPFSSYALVQT